MKYTEKFNLKKPEQSDSYNVNDFNDNMDLIEKLLTPEDISSKFVVTPVDETAQFAEIDDIRAYKQGNIISGDISLKVSGGGEHELYFFEIPQEYETRTAATTSAFGRIENSYYPYESSVSCMFESSGLLISVQNPSITYVIVSFTYICE